MPAGAATLEPLRPGAGPSDARLALELAAARRVGERLDGHALELVVVALDLAQVDVLHRVAGRRDRELAARTVDRDLRIAVVITSRLARSPFAAVRPAARICAAS